MIIKNAFLVFGILTMLNTIVFTVGTVIEKGMNPGEILSVLTAGIFSFFTSVILSLVLA
jgi:1,4-dihydroxy-2-naphthoate octaprenyltransferase